MSVPRQLSDPRRHRLTRIQSLIAFYERFDPSSSYSSWRQQQQQQLGDDDSCPGQGRQRPTRPPFTSSLSSPNISLSLGSSFSTAAAASSPSCSLDLSHEGTSASSATGGGLTPTDPLPTEPQQQQQQPSTDYFTTNLSRSPSPSLLPPRLRLVIQKQGHVSSSVSYTHLTLPTIYSV